MSLVTASDCGVKRSLMASRFEAIEGAEGCGSVGMRMVGSGASRFGVGQRFGMW